VIGRSVLLGSALLALSGFAFSGQALPSFAFRSLALPGVALPGVALPGVALPGVALPGFALPNHSVQGLAVPSLAVEGSVHGEQSPTSVSRDRAPREKDAGWGRAPDGERGFGPGRTVRDLARLLRSPAEEDKGFVASLYKLEDELRVLLAMATEHYKTSGYFDLVLIAKAENVPTTGAQDAARTQLEELGDAFRARAAHATAALEKGGTGADLLARLLVDTRFRVRAQVIDGLEFEFADLRAGLAVLFAELDGFTGLKDAEADAIASRVDLAASRLRAAKLDLEVLREDRADERVVEAWGKDLEALFELIRTEDAARRSRELPDLLAKLEDRESNMSSALFTTRLETNLAPELEKRQKDLAAAQDILPRVRTLVLGDKTEAKQKGVSKNQRFTEAARDATAGLALDPLAEELNFLEGEVSDFLQGSLESRRYFDRYLALRGIRVHDYRTYQGKNLSREEKRAIEVVQAAGGGPQPGTPGGLPQIQPPK
jgi:hypothetical protein